MIQHAGVASLTIGGRGPSAKDKRVKLRELLAGGELQIVPTSYDALTASIIEQQGYEIVHFSGFYASAAIARVPDIGLLSMKEMVDASAAVCKATTVPVIADADDGYGGPLQVFRAVSEYSSAGVAGIHLEDQTAPKRCGLMRGRTVIPKNAMREKIQAAVDARPDPSLVLIARTDARESEGLDSAIDRARSYLEAGADACIVEGPESIEEMRIINQSLSGPHVGGWSAFDKSASLTREDLVDIGYSLVFFVDGPLSIHHVYSNLHKRLLKDGKLDGLQENMTSYEDWNRSMGLSAWRELEESLRR
ncbi:isocitrate lyase/PEP mutase family protein [Specibacter sp. RAF43]|uniref:isocitrate lyase/PEP mutase family protein n=1 Tax=Specibacter sp. RAF43 TaxID=3233057 RepID=UPI003F9B69F6